MINEFGLQDVTTTCKAVHLRTHNEWDYMWAIVFLFNELSITWDLRKKLSFLDFDLNILIVNTHNSNFSLTNMYPALTILPRPNKSRYHISSSALYFLNQFLMFHFRFSGVRLRS